MKNAINRRSFVAGAATITGIAITPIVGADIKQQLDPLIEVGRKHTHALKKWITAADASPTGNWDTPDCDYWHEERWKHIRVLLSTQATSVKGLLGQFNMIEGEFSNGGFEHDGGYIEIEADTLANIKRTLEVLAKAGKTS